MTADVRHGVGYGLWFATLFSAFVLAMAALRQSVHYERMGGLTTWQVIGFYYGAGIAGGAAFGLLRPWRKRYAGRFATAYLVLYLVYGGGTSVFYPLITKGDADPAPLSGLLTFWAVLCLVLAPFYVKMSED